MSATLTSTLPISSTVEQRWIVRLLPSLTDFAFLIPAVLMLWLFPDGFNTLLGDGDTGWHIRTGEWILQHGAIPRHDLFSFTRPGQTWFAWEWGWDVLFALIHSFAGLAGVVFVNLVLLCFVAALLFRAVRAMCNHDVLALFVTAVGLIASVVHWLARPHLLSWVLFLVLLRALRRAELGETKQLLWLPALVLFWTNVHGSFFLAVFMIVLSAAGQCLYFLDGTSFTWRELWRRSRPFSLCAAACGLVTFVNPYTWHVHAHIWQYLHDASLLDTIQEFLSPDFHHGPSVVFGWLLLPSAAAILWCYQQRNWSGLLSLIAWTHFSLIARRNIPICVFIACPLVAGMLNQAVGHHLRTAWPRGVTLARNLQRWFSPFERIERYHAASGLVLCYIALCLATRQPGYEAKFPSRCFPSAALPVIEQAQAKRVFTTDQWGDYLLYKLYPSTRVFVDGRSDFFGAPYLERCRNILNARWDWEDDLNRFLVDMVIVTPDTPVATVLKRSHHWRVLFDNGSVIVFGAQRESAAAGSPMKDTRISAVHQDGGKRLEADLAFKYRTHNYERRCA